MKGLFITFEGADGSGKSTQLRFLAEYLEERGVPVVLTREPGGCPVAEKIRDILLDKESEMDAITEAMLYAAARAAHVRQVIRPALDAGYVVLCDRFIHSSLAYQGYGRSLGVELVRQINTPAMDGCLPDVTVFINVPPERAFERMNEHKVHDRLESEDLSFHQRVFDGFTQLSKGNSIISIDAKGTKHETREIILQSLMPLFLSTGIL
jgi:dTMP kinase